MAYRWQDRISRYTLHEYYAGQNGNCEDCESCLPAEIESMLVCIPARFWRSALVDKKLGRTKIIRGFK